MRFASRLFLLPLIAACQPLTELSDVPVESGTEATEDTDPTAPPEEAEEDDGAGWVDGSGAPEVTDTGAGDTGIVPEPEVEEDPLPTEGPAILGVFTNPDCTGDSATVSTSELVTLYIALHGTTDFPSATGAELRLEGVPTDWAAWVVADPAITVTIGTPNDGNGANLAYASCQAATACLPLYEVMVQPLATGTYTLGIEAKNPPANPTFDCPLITECDAPLYTKQCADTRGVQLIVE